MPFLAAIPVGAAIAGSAAIGGVASIVAGNKASKGAKAAAQTQAKAAEKASDAQLEAAKIADERLREQYDQDRADLAPWRKIGRNALTQYAHSIGVELPEITRDEGESDADFNQRLADRAKIEGRGRNEDFYKSPDYNFRLNEGTKAVERSMAARGLLNSGASQKALTRFGQDTAGSAYNTYTNRLAALAGLGQSATNTTVQLGAQSANNQANIALGAGNARATGYLNSGNAIAQGQIGAANAWSNAFQGVGSAIQGGIGDYVGYKASQDAYNQQNAILKALSG